VGNSRAEQQLAELDAVIAALAHPARRQILLTIHLRGGEVAAGEIAARFAHSWPTTSRHLQVLEAAGLVRAEQQGRVRSYSVDVKKLDTVREWLAWFERAPP
jgi:DNA-binding transcriptional ArsR family regulator